MHRSHKKFAIPRSFESLEQRCCLTTAFLPHDVFETSPSFQRVTTADLDLDGDADIISSSYDENRFRWHENLGNGEFQVHDLNGQYNGALAVNTGDLNGDGRPDIVVGARLRLLYFKNVQFGGELQLLSYDIDREVPGIREIEIFDVDLDGDDDLVVSHGEFVRWYENINGRGDFRNRGVVRRFGNLVTQLTVLDANGDEYLDVAAVTYAFSTSRYSQVAILVGTGTGFSDTTLNTRSTSPVNDLYSVEAGDIDDDGDQDLVIGYRFGQIQILINDGGKFTFGPLVTSEADSPQSMTLLDMDNDADLDVVSTSAANDRIAWFENHGNNTFASSGKVLSNDLNPASISVADIDLDGDLDLVAGFDGDPRSNIRWYERRIVGDADDDGVFNSSDLVAVFAAGEYEDDVEMNSTFETGDWNRDGEFNTTDLVVAFQAGTYSSAALPTSPIRQIRDNSILLIPRQILAIDRLLDGQDELDWTSLEFAT